MLASILVGLYGNYPKLSLRAIDSLITPNHEFPIYVGMNDCCIETKIHVRNLLDEGLIDAVVDSSRNINKDPMMRILLELVQTPFLIWLDDDSHMFSGWDSCFKDYLIKYGPHLDVAGHLFQFVRQYEPELQLYEDFARKRPWFVTEEVWKDPHIFPMGALWLARTSFLRKNDYPDRAMIKKMADILVGELVMQQKARLFPFDEEIMKYIAINDDIGYGRRGKEDLWKEIDLKTGQVR